VLQARESLRALWARRVERAGASLAAYREATRYPHESQPIATSPTRCIRTADRGRTAAACPRRSHRRRPALRTSQERVFVQGQESVRFESRWSMPTASRKPLAIVRAVARELPPPRSGPTYRR
jgi:hypothetical protein